MMTLWLGICLVQGQRPAFNKLKFQRRNYTNFKQFSFCTPSADFNCIKSQENVKEWRHSGKKTYIWLEFEYVLTEYLLPNCWRSSCSYQPVLDESSAKPNCCHLSGFPCWYPVLLFCSENIGTYKFTESSESVWLKLKCNFWNKVKTFKIRKQIGIFNFCNDFFEIILRDWIYSVFQKS